MFIFRIGVHKHITTLYIKLLIVVQMEPDGAGVERGTGAGAGGGTGAGAGDEEKVGERRRKVPSEAATSSSSTFLSH